MRVDFEVRIGGKPDRACCATIERDPRKKAEQGIGLQLARNKETWQVTTWPGCLRF